MTINAIAFPTFQRAMRQITAITNAFPAQVTTSFDHQYQSGLIVRLVIPNVPDNYGMHEANNLTGTITVNSPTTFLIDIDTTNFSAFIIPTAPVGRLPAGALLQFPQVIPIGEINNILTEATQNVLPYP